MVKMENIPSERSFAERDFQVFNTWGKKAIVVNDPANKPNKLIPFIVIHFLPCKVTEHFDEGCRYVRLLANKPVTSIAEIFYPLEAPNQVQGTCDLKYLISSTSGS